MPDPQHRIAQAARCGGDLALIVAGDYLMHAAGALAALDSESKISPLSSPLSHLVGIVKAAELLGLPSCSDPRPRRDVGTGLLPTLRRREVDSNFPFCALNERRTAPISRGTGRPNALLSRRLPIDKITSLDARLRYLRAVSIRGVMQRGLRCYCHYTD